jgi:hypothetical protein
LDRNLNEYLVEVKVKRKKGNAGDISTLPMVQIPPIHLILESEYLFCNAPRSFMILGFAGALDLKI